jgi:hypothetical protein
VLAEYFEGKVNREFDNAIMRNIIDVQGMIDFAASKGWVSGVREVFRVVKDAAIAVQLKEREK